MRSTTQQHDCVIELACMHVGACIVRRGGVEIDVLFIPCAVRGVLTTALMQWLCSLTGR